MKTMSCLLPVLVAGAMCVAQAQDPPVKVELYSSVSQVKPGDGFFLGLHFELPPGWHVYWENPGDSGMPPKIRVSGPEGFTVREVQFPGPERIAMPGGLVNFGYEGDVMFLVPVIAPVELEGAAVEFVVDAEWLVCKEQCVLQKARRRLTLGVVPDMDAPDHRSPQSELFGQWRRRLPTPLAALSAHTARWSGEGAGARLNLGMPGATQVEFFPGPEAPVSLRHQVRDRDGDGMRVDFWQEVRPGEAAAPLRVSGILRVTRGTETRDYLVELSH